MMPRVPCTRWRREYGRGTETVCWSMIVLPPTVRMRLVFMSPTFSFWPARGLPFLRPCAMKSANAAFLESMETM